MRRSQIVSARPNYLLRRAVATAFAVAVALCATYGLFLGTAALMVVFGLAA